MFRFLVVFFLILFSQFSVFAEEINYDDIDYDFDSKLESYVEDKKYKKALDICLKKKQNEKLTPEETEYLRVIMEELLSKKEKNDALKSFWVLYDKYEDIYKYRAKNWVHGAFTPVVTIANDKNVHFYILFQAFHTSRRASTFSDVIINSGYKQNTKLKVVDSEDFRISNDTYVRTAKAMALLNHREIFLVEDALKGDENISFKMRGSERSAYNSIYVGERKAYQKAIIVYLLLLYGDIKPGQKRF